MWKYKSSVGRSCGGGCRDYPWSLGHEESTSAWQICHHRNEARLELKTASMLTCFNLIDRCFYTMQRCKFLRWRRWIDFLDCKWREHQSVEWLQGPSWVLWVCSGGFSGWSQAMEVIDWHSLPTCPRWSIDHEPNIEETYSKTFGCCLVKIAEQAKKQDIFSRTKDDFSMWCEGKMFFWDIWNLMY